MAQRLHFSTAELASMQGRSLAWPAVSISLLCLFTVAAPAGLVTALNLYLVLIVALAWAARGRPSEKPLWWAVLPFAAAIVIGFAGGAGASRYLVFKDAWYYTNPAITLIVGYVFGRILDDPRRGLRAFVIGGTLVACFHAVPFVMHPDLLLRSAVQIRTAAGTGYQATALGLIIMVGSWGHWRERLAMNRWAVALCLSLCGASALLSFSRTMALVVILGCLATGGFFARREWLRLGALVLIALLAITALRAGVETDSLEAKHSFIGKLARSLDELDMTDRMSVREVNENWRGYETARALDTVAQGSAWQWLTGRGFGAQVDLEIFQKLTPNPREAVRFIPVFHNGYIYLLIKTGIVGIGLYLASMGWLYAVGRRAAQSTGNGARDGRLLQGCVVVLVVTTWVVSGAFNKYDMFVFLLLCGFLLAVLNPVLNSVRARHVPVAA